MKNTRSYPPEHHMWNNTPPLHLALIKNNRTAVLFLIAYGGDIHFVFNFDFNSHTAESYARSYREDLLPIVSGDADNARDILISEGLLEEEEKFVKPAKR